MFARALPVILLSLPSVARGDGLGGDLFPGIGVASVAVLALAWLALVLKRRRRGARKAAPPAREETAPRPRPAVAGGLDPQWLGHALLAYDAEGRVVLWNRAAARLLGYDEAQILGRPVSRLLPPWCAGEVAEHLARVQGEEAPEGLETQRLDAAGRILDVHLELAPYRPDPAGPVGVLCSLFDLTSRRVAERDRELRVRALEAADEAVVITDATDDNRVLYVNAAMQRVTGYPPEALVGRNLRLLQGEEHRQEALESLRGCLRRGEACRVVLHNVRADGTPFWNELTVTPVRNEAGRLVQYVGVLRDVGELRSERTRLRRDAERWRMLLDLAPVGALVCDDGGTLLAVNRRLCELLGCEPQRLLGRPFSSLLAEPSPRDPPVPGQGELQLKGAGGQVLTVRVSRVAMEDGEQALYLTDVTDRRRAERHLHQEQERVQGALASMGDAVITTNSRGLVDYLNPTAEAITGWRSEEAQGQPVVEVFRVVNEGSRNPVPDPVRRCLALGRRIRLPVGALLLSRCGREVPIQASAAPIHGPEHQLMGAVLVMQDISESRRRAREAGEQAASDPLTGLINRRELEHQLRELLNSVRDEHKTHALCYLDLDHFKPVNDQCGHAAGDQVLRQIAGLLREQVRSSDSVARIGGDEFALLLRGCTRRKALAIAGNACRAVERYRWRWRGREFALGASIGLVNLERAGLTVEEVLRAADEACYQAKDAGRGQVWVHDPEQGPGAGRDPGSGWVQRIGRAMEEGGLELMVQTFRPLARGAARPLYRFSVRYRDARGQVAEAGAFLPELERYRALPELDRWVLDEALDALERVPAEAGLPVLCLSGQGLADPGLAELLKTRLARSALDLRNLCFELREPDLVGAPAAAMQLLETVRGFGCRLSLAEFSGGLSLLGPLRGQVFDYLCWGRSISTTLKDGPVGEALVDGLNQVAHAAGARSIAEGVDDEVSLARLRAMLVDYAGGRVVAQERQVEAVDWKQGAG